MSEPCPDCGVDVNELTHTIEEQREELSRLREALTHIEETGPHRYSKETIEAMKIIARTALMPPA